jgi:hypothetical protein
MRTPGRAVAAKPRRKTSARAAPAAGANLETSKKIGKPPNLKERPKAVSWFTYKQDKNSRTAYTNGLKVQIDSVSNHLNYRGTLSVNGPNEAFIVLLEKSGTTAEINAESSNILRAIANDLILLAEELCPSKCSPNK